MTRSVSLLLAAGILAAGTLSGFAQDTTVRPANLGLETGNFGLVPFTPIPTYTLTDAQKAEVRALEDRQLQERRALEDQFAADMKALLARQAEERSALVKTLTGQ